MRLAPLLALLLLATGVHAQTDASVIPDDAPDWRPLAEAVEHAAAGDKVLLLHGYAKWCGWCSRLDQDVYTDDDVQAYLADNFELARMDIENRETVDFFDFRLPTAWLASGLGITSTPTTIFMDAASGEVITRLPGYADQETFLYALQYVREGAYAEISFNDWVNEQKEAEAGEDDAPLVPLAE